MKKVLFGTVDYCGKPAKIKCYITDNDGYLSITADIIPYRCRTPHCCGCCHDEIQKAFPELKPFIWLHLVDVKDGSVMHEVANSLYMLANDDEKAAQSVLNCTDEEIRELSALVHYGLTRTKTWWGYKDKKPGYEIKGEDNRRVYENALNKLNLRARRLNALNDLYSVLSRMK